MQIDPLFHNVVSIEEMRQRKLRATALRQYDRNRRDLVRECIESIFENSPYRQNRKGN